MESRRLCINKSILYIFLFGLLVSFIVLLTTSIQNQNLSVKTRASTSTLDYVPTPTLGINKNLDELVNIIMAGTTIPLPTETQMNESSEGTDNTLIISRFFENTQNLNVVTETGTTLPVVVHYPFQTPQYSQTINNPTHIPNATPTIAPILVNAKIKCITINKVKLTMNCMASMVSEYATIFGGYGTPEFTCFNLVFQRQLAAR